MKKIALVFLLVLIFGVITFFSQPQRYTGCAFCDEEVLLRQKYYEDDLIYVLLSHKPILPGHSLIIPKRHVERFEELTDEEITRIGQTIKKVHAAASQVFHTSSYLLLQKNGQEVGQTVPHVHVHYLPRQAGDDSTLKFIFNLYLANALSPISNEEMQKLVEQMQAAMKS